MKALGIALAGLALLAPAARAQDAFAPSPTPTANDVGLGNAPAPLVGPFPDLDPPTEKEIRDVLDHVRDYCVRTAVYRIVDANTGQAITDFSKPTPTATLDPAGRDFNSWTYEMGVAHSGMLLASEVTGDASFADFTFKTFGFLFDRLDYFRSLKRDPGHSPDAFDRMLTPHTLDDCGSMSAALIKANLTRQDARYLDVIKTADAHVSRGQFRLSDGTLARVEPEPQTLWLDDLYMSVPFLAQMGRMSGERRYYDDGARQVVQMAARMFDRDKNLWDHNFYVGVQYDPKFYWARANGWALMAIVELLSVLPEDHPQRAQLIDLLKRSAAGLQGAQSGTGLWHQLLDKNDSYLETSSSAMFVYAIARGVNRGWIEPVYAPVAYIGWKAVARRVAADGSVSGVCIGTSSAYENAYYYNRPTEPPQPMHGYGPVLLAGAETLKMLRDFTVLPTRSVRRRPTKPGS